MYFVIGGVQPRTVLLSRQPRTCPACGYPKLFLKRIDHYLSLFFIPLIPVKRGDPVHLCDNCSTSFSQYDQQIDFSRGAAGLCCPNCGRSIERDFAFCPYCGKSV